LRLFLDTSALLKRYVRERGSEVVDSALGRAEAVGVCVLAWPETVSALVRLRREGRLEEEAGDRLKAAVARDLEAMDVCDLTPWILDRAVACLERHRLRTLDALHLAAALVWRADVLLSADRRQLAAAAAEGLATLDAAGGGQG